MPHTILVCLLVAFALAGSPAASAQSVDTRAGCRSPLVRGLGFLRCSSLRDTDYFKIYSQEKRDNIRTLALQSVDVGGAGAGSIGVTGERPVGGLAPEPESRYTYSVGAAPERREALLDSWRRFSAYQDPENPNTLIVNRYRAKKNSRDQADDLAEERDSYETPPLLYLELANRQYARFIEAEHGPSAVAIPARVRTRIFNLEGDAPTSATSNATSDFALGVYYNWRGIERYFRYEEGRKTMVSGTGRTLNAGFLLAGSVVTVDKDSATRDLGRFANDAPSISMLVLSPGVGVGAGYGDASINFFAGLDLGVGSGVGSWDYHKALWIGVGVSTSDLLPF